MNGVEITKLDMMQTPGGDVMHGLKSIDSSFVGFGEAYFSIIDHQSIKGWKRHKRMTLNLIVPTGSVKFVIHDDRIESSSYGEFKVVELSRDNYNRLTISPMLWLGFQGIGKEENIVLNVASIPHDPEEVDKKDVEEFNFCW
tara:strand:+ start:425 stop:850 length:426 start_codon:yes stop_codon:yes gene_type:complete